MYICIYLIWIYIYMYICAHVRYKAWPMWKGRSHAPGSHKAVAADGSTRGNMKTIGPLAPGCLVVFSALSCIIFTYLYQFMIQNMVYHRRLYTVSIPYTTISYSHYIYIHVYIYKYMYLYIISIYIYINTKVYQLLIHNSVVVYCWCQGTGAPERLGLSLPRAPSPEPWQTPGPGKSHGKSWQIMGIWR